MDEQTKTKLQLEAATGEDWERVYKSKLMPFFSNKRAELFQAFQDIPTSEKDQLLTLKLQCNALTSLEEEFLSRIHTGVMARQALSEEKENE
jgi:hypothetical protein